MRINCILTIFIANIIIIIVIKCIVYYFWNYLTDIRLLCSISLSDKNIIEMEDKKQKYVNQFSICIEC
jgi:hypothetical protein